MASASACESNDDRPDVPPVSDDNDDEVQAFQVKCREEMQSRLNNLQGNFQVSLDDHEFTDLAERFHSHSRVQIATRQVDVLRANKIFRDVARFMGSADWRPLFQQLVGALPQEVVRAELTRIEREKAFIQPYKALTVWKELSGENFHIEALVEALNTCGMNELADKTLVTLQSEGDSLYSLSDFGKSAIASSSRPSQAPSSTARKQSTSKSEIESETSRAKLAPSQSTSDGSDPPPTTGTDGLGDGQLLRLARKIGGSWVSLGKALNLPSDQVKEIWEKEGDTYQGAFQMLWVWRDNTCSLSLLDAIGGLCSALEKINRTDLADEVRKWS